MLKVAALGLTVAVALAVACGGGGGGGDRATPTPGADLTRSVEAGGVTVDGTWLVAESVGEADADLSAYPQIDMEQASGLKQGDQAAAPVAWVSLSDDSHHRGGVLVFKRTEADGPVELTVDLGDEEVSLRWESPPA